MEFEIEYNNIKNRNIFYFKYYCQDRNEFNQWLDHNSIFDIYNEFYIEYQDMEPSKEEYESWTDLFKQIYKVWNEYSKYLLYYDDYEDEDYSDY